MNEQTAAFDPSALVEEAAKKSGLIWVRVPGERDQAVWHLWHEGAAYVLVGTDEQNIEQPLQGIEAASTVDVTIRSKDKGVRLVGWQATVERVEAGSETWSAVVELMLGKRLNLPDGEAAADRWERECALYRLAPVEGLVEGPGSYQDTSHAEEPRESRARTRVPRPFHLTRMRRRG